MTEGHDESYINGVWLAGFPLVFLLVIPQAGLAAGCLVGLGSGGGGVALRLGPRRYSLE